MKNKKPTNKQLQDKIWIEVRRIIKNRYPDVCYTCGAKPLIGANRHTGHLISKKYLNAFLKYDLRVCRPQCYFCNIHAGGMGALFIENMREIEGDQYVENILFSLDVKVKPKEMWNFYNNLLEEYKLIK